jgi:predicted branched-subunit amino acid permease
MVPITWVVCPLLGLPIGALFFFPDEWGLGRRLAAGLFAGVFTALILTANRLIGRSESI